MFLFWLIVIGIFLFVILKIASAFSDAFGSTASNKAVSNSNRGRYKDEDDDDDDAKTIRTKIVGVTYKNEDGSVRQEYLSECSEGDLLELVHTPSERFPEAVGVFTLSGNQLGNIKAELATELVQYLEDGHELSAEIIEITGGTSEKPTIGCNIEISIE